VTPYAGAAKDFVDQWREGLTVRDKRFYQGVGWGADMNGFGSQGPPRGGPNPVTYPFKNWDGTVTVGRQHSGQRVYDINKDGVAHYGLYPDWVEDLRHLAGPQIVDDLGRGAEAYLQMWERADGIPAGCRPARAKASSRGLAGARLGAGTSALLRRAGQPRARGARRWSWCAGNGRLSVALTPAGRVALVGATARGHKARGIHPGTKSKRAKRGTRAFGAGIRKRGRYVYVLRKGRVRAVAVTTAKSRKSVRRLLKRAALR
jgi:hypothetical protein